MARSIGIRPHVGVFALFSAVDYRAWYALAEFVDNAIQSFLDQYEAIEEAEGRRPLLTIAIDPDVVTGDGGRAIRVWDNAGGIPNHRFDQAFEVATPPPDPTGLHVYGIGMKSAAAWFGDNFAVRTSALGEPVARTIVFDFPEIIADRLDEIPAHEEPAPSEDHYTEILLSKLHHPIQTLTHDKVRRHLASIFRTFLRRGDVSIVYDGEPLEYAEPEVLAAPFYQTPDAEPVGWSKTIDITLDSGERIHGFAALRRRADTKAPGFALFRENRVITGIEDDPWRPVEVFGPANKFPAQRLFGELHLENVKVSYSKNGFVWQAAEEELIASLRSALDEEPIPLLKQATGYRARVAEEAERDAATRALDRTVQAIAENASDVLDTELETEAAPDPPEDLSPAPAVTERTVELHVGGESWSVIAELTNIASDHDWLAISDNSVDARRIRIRISLAHPFSRRFAATDADDLEAIVRLGASLALAIVIARMQGAVHVGTVLRTFNSLLGNALAGG